MNRTCAAGIQLIKISACCTCVLGKDSLHNLLATHSSKSHMLLWLWPAQPCIGLHPITGHCNDSGTEHQRLCRPAGMRRHCSRGRGRWQHGGMGRLENGDCVAADERGRERVRGRGVGMRRGRCGMSREGEGPQRRHEGCFGPDRAHRIKRFSHHCTCVVDHHW